MGYKKIKKGVGSLGGRHACQTHESFIVILNDLKIVDARFPTVELLATGQSTSWICQMMSVQSSPPTVQPSGPPTGQEK